MRALFLFLSLLLSTSCMADPDHQDRSSEETRAHIKRVIASFKSQPNYSVQVDKGGCRLELIGNDMPLYGIHSKGGFSGLIPFNANILESGQQKLLIKIYPDQGKDHFDEYTRASVEVMYWKNTDDNISEGVKVTSFEIPKEAIEGKLGYYEAILDFEADVPFDFSRDLSTAKALKDIPGIDAKVVETYEKIREWIKKKDMGSLADFRKRGDERLSIEFYYRSDEEIAEAFDYSFLLKDDKTLDPMPEYKMVFYADGKLVRLERAGSKEFTEEVITLTGRTGDGYEATSDLGVLLYIPEGGNELMQY